MSSLSFDNAMRFLAQTKASFWWVIYVHWTKTGFMTAKDCTLIKTFWHTKYLLGMINIKILHSSLKKSSTNFKIFETIP